MMKGENLQPRTFYPARLLFRFDREIKSFIDKQKLREFYRQTKASLVTQLVKNPPAMQENPWVGKIPWRRKWQNTLQYSCLGNLMDRGAWQATVHGVSRVGHNAVTKPPNKLNELL